MYGNMGRRARGGVVNKTSGDYLIDNWVYKHQCCVVMYRIPEARRWCPWCQSTILLITLTSMLRDSPRGLFLRPGVTDLQEGSLSLSGEVQPCSVSTPSTFFFYLCLPSLLGLRVPSLSSSPFSSTFYSDRQIGAKYQSALTSNIVVIMEG